MRNFLGEQIAGIAAEKAGIIKPGVPLIVGNQDDTPRDVILRRADALSAPAYVFGQDFFAHRNTGAWSIRIPTACSTCRCRI